MPEVTGPLTTTADSDTYPTHDSELGVGGLREVADHAARNVIPSDRRRGGMMVFTQSDGTYWTLNPSPWDGSDGDWAQAFTLGGYRAPVTYVLTSVSSWNQVHNFPYRPEARLIDAANNSVEINIEYPDDTHVYIEFPQPFSGTVILS